MNRLTRKHKPTNYTRYTEKTICLKNYNIRSANLNKAIEKLGKLEDIEEELGCPLEVIIEATKNGIILNNNKIYDCKPSYYEKVNGWTFVCCIGGEAQVGFALKDYQKTWWLKGEKENV